MHCEVCDLPLPPRTRCPNFWCRREDRGFDVSYAVGSHTGRLRRAIAGLKYRGEDGWVPVLSSLLGGYLLEHMPVFDDVDLIVGVPSNVGSTRPVDHVRQLLDWLDPTVGNLWEIAPVLAKRAETTPLATTTSAIARRVWAAGELRAALEVTDPPAVEGRRVLAVDDVFTDGSTLREVALALKKAGAAAVSGLVLARQPLRRYR